MSKDDKFYMEIWEEREHVSEVTGKHLGDTPNRWFFAHVIRKGSYPSFRHRKDNIMLMTPEQHFKYDHETHKAKADPDFDKVFKKALELKREYNHVKT